MICFHRNEMFGFSTGESESKSGFYMHNAHKLEKAEMS